MYNISCTFFGHRVSRILALDDGNFISKICDFINIFLCGFYWRWVRFYYYYFIIQLILTASLLIIFYTYFLFYFNISKTIVDTFSFKLLNFQLPNEIIVIGADNLLHLQLFS